MDDRRPTTIGDLLDLLLADRLIDACHMTSEYVTVVQGTKRHSFPYQKARAFLRGMLRGRSWNEEQPTSSEGGDGAPLRTVDTTRDVDRQYPFEPAVDEMLRIAAEMGIIKESKHDYAAGVVTISLSACETKMSPGEALAFLAECILHKLNEISRMQAPARPAEWNGQAYLPMTSRVVE